MDGMDAARPLAATKQQIGFRVSGFGFRRIAPAPKWGTAVRSGNETVDRVDGVDGVDRVDAPRPAEETKTTGSGAKGRRIRVIALPSQQATAQELT